ncbi:unnamed protein product, partial [Iphiclides podalirius]
MNERKMLLFVLSALLYGVYCVNMWFTTRNADGASVDSGAKTVKFAPEIIANGTARTAGKKTKSAPRLLKDACSALQVFTERPLTKRRKRDKESMEPDNNTVTVIGITTFLIILILNAVLDVLKAKEEERAKRKLNPDGGRRHSLAEFANKKNLRRESSKFGLQLFQIAETKPQEGTKEERKTRKSYTRGDSINSYLSDKKRRENSAPASVVDTPAEVKLAKRQSVAKLFGLSDE